MSDEPTYEERIRSAASWDVMSQQKQAEEILSKLHALFKLWEGGQDVQVSLVPGSHAQLRVGANAYVAAKALDDGAQIEIRVYNGNKITLLFDVDERRFKKYNSSKHTFEGSALDTTERIWDLVAPELRKNLLKYWSLQ